MTCPAGHACKSGTADPERCVAGTKARATKDLCDLCAAGTYQDQELQSSCKTCPRGSFCPTGATAPASCGLATAAPDEGMPLCSTCVEGTYEDSLGSSACKICPNGFFCPAGSAPSRASEESVLPKPGKYASCGSRTDAASESFDGVCRRTRFSDGVAAAAEDDEDEERFMLIAIFANSRRGSNCNCSPYCIV